MKFTSSLLLAAVAIVSLTAGNVNAQSVKLVVRPDTHAISQPNDYVVANHNEVSYIVAGINLKTTATTNVATLPTFTAPGAITASLTAKFYPTSVKVITTTGTSVSGGAIVTVGSTGTSATSIAGSTTLSSSAVTNGIENIAAKANTLALAQGDVLTFTVGTGATATTQTSAVVVRGFWQ